MVLHHEEGTEMRVVVRKDSRYRAWTSLSQREKHDLAEYAAQMNTSKSEIVRRALRDYLSKQSTL